MLTLTKAGEETKIALKWIGISVCALIILYFAYKITVYIKDVLFPPPPPPPAVAFGKISVPGFPQNTVSKKFTYSIDTLSGQLPILDYQIKVYRMLNYYPDLLAVQKTQDKVSSIGFGNSPIQLSNRLYQWGNDPKRSGIPRNIIVDTINYNFSINSSFAVDPSILSGQNLPSISDSIDLAKNTLGSMNLIPDDLDYSKTKTITYAIDKNGQLVTTTSYANAQIIQVNFFQQNVDKLPILYDNPNLSTMTFLVSGGDQGQIVSANYVHQAISGLSSTYPVKTSKEAFDELKKGNAYIASYFGDSSNINIRDVYFAYYIGSNLQNYLDPIIVFQGDNGFYAYIDAVTGEWIGN
jgi:hypothetical protein